MKKIYSSTLLLLLSAFFGQINAQTTHFSEDFGGGIGAWTANDRDGDGYNWGSTVLSGTNFDAQGAVAYSESYSGGSVLTPDNLLISPAINLASATGTVSLSYKIGSYRTSYYSEYFSVYVAHDISNINTVLSSTPIQTLQVPAAESFVNYSFDISSFAGDNSVYLVFRHYNCTDQYELVLDDVLVQSSGGGGGTGDLAILKSYNGNIEQTMDYTMIANSQRAALTVGSKIANLTSSSASNTLSVVINDGTSNVYTGSQAFTVAGLDTAFVWITTNYTPAINKTYTMTFTLASDGNNSNNTSTNSFQTQNDYYAHDVNATQSFGTTALGTDYYVVNAFEIKNTATLYSIDVKLLAGTTPNQTLRVFLSSSNGFIGEGSKLITSADINNGQFTRIYLDAPQSIGPNGAGFFYFVGFGSETLLGNLYVGSNNLNDDFASGVLSNGSYVNTDKTIALRMNFNQGCASFDAQVGNIMSAQSCNPNSGRVELMMTTGGNAVANQNNISWTGAGTGSLSNQNNTTTVTGLAAGNYNFTVSNNGCSTTISNVSVGSIQSPTVSVSELTPISCFGQADGAVSYTTSGTTTGYTFTWNTGATSTSLTGLSSGVYTISGTNGVCNITQSFTLNDPAEIVVNATKTNVTACGGTNGSIQLSCTGGSTSNYLYTWTGPSTGTSGTGFGSTFSINTLPAGNYTVTVTNGSCSSTVVVSISENSAPQITVANISPISCPGDTDGTLKVTSSANLTGYTFTWSTGATGINLNNVGAGSYTVTGTNGTCTTTGNFVLEDPAAIEITGLAAISTITTTVTGGTGNLSYSWSGPAGFTSSAANLSGLTSLGTYNVTVTDQNGCSETASFVLQFLGQTEIAKDEATVKFYPNPTNALINFELPADVNSIQIYDYTGKLIESVQVNSELEIVNLENYPNGIYFFKVISNDKSIYSNKITLIK